jgi:hypothetical protein
VNDDSLPLERYTIPPFIMRKKMTSQNKNKRNESHMEKSRKIKKEERLAEKLALADVLERVPAEVWHNIFDMLILDRRSGRYFAQPHNVVHWIGSIARSCKLLNRAIQSYPPYMAITAMCHTSRTRIYGSIWWKKFFVYFIKSGKAMLPKEAKKYEQDSVREYQKQMETWY